MKIDCHVIATETTGDGLRVTMQGKPPSAADWRALERQEIILPDTEATRRAFYVGREVTITVKAK